MDIVIEAIPAVSFVVALVAIGVSLYISKRLAPYRQTLQKLNTELENTNARITDLANIVHRVQKDLTSLTQTGNKADVVHEKDRDQVKHVLKGLDGRLTMAEKVVQMCGERRAEQRTMLQQHIGELRVELQERITHIAEANSKFREELHAATTDWTQNAVSREIVDQLIRDTKEEVHARIKRIEDKVLS